MAGTNFSVKRTNEDGNTEYVHLTDRNDDPMLITGSNVPSSGTYAKGAIFIKEDAGSSTKALYENQGTTSSVDFNVIGDITSAEIGSGAVGAEELGLQKVTFQGDSVLDLTDNTSTTTLAASGSVSASRGGDKVIPIKAQATITTEIAGDNTAPQVTIQDEDDTSTGLVMDNFADADSADAVRIKDLADGTDTTPVDLTSKALEAKVTTAAADSGTAAGECKIHVDCILVK